MASLACAALALSWQGIAVGQTGTDYLKERTVRVIARGVDPNTAASGFLWKHQNWVVTNLHSIPSDRDIKVSCLGVTQNARVLKVLPSADLALLEVERSNTDKPPLHLCKPFTDAHFEVIDGAELTTYGWLGDARLSGLRFMRKTGEGPLRGFFPSNLEVLKALDDFGIPDTKRTDFYILQGGSLPGYSGASIVDENNRLVAIVDGGLNEGMNTVKWAIPAGKLGELELHGTPWQPRYGQKPEWLWSSGIADPDEFSVLEYTEVDTYNPDTGESTTFDYSWHRTKTLSLGQLARTAIDRDGILSLLALYGGAVRGRIDPAGLERSAHGIFEAAVAAGVDPSFDVYEELDQELIIAVPAGQGLSFEPVRNNPGYYWLESESNRRSGGHIQFSRTRNTVTSSVDLVPISPGEPRYFAELISELIADCNEPGQTECVLDENTLRIIRFGTGKEILKLGMFVRWPDGRKAYDYRSIAVRDGVAFNSYARFSWGDDTGLLQCGFTGSQVACSDPALALTQLSQMLAVHLTTFANFGSTGSERSLETRFVYDARNNHPSTIGVGYFEGDELRFHNTRGNMWRQSLPGRINKYHEYQRDEDHVWLSFGNEHAIIPIAGGEYFTSDDNGETWTRAGTLVRD